MRSLAAAISPGLFGFTDWAFATEAPSEIAVQVPRATRKNNALIIISFHIRSFLRMRPICFSLINRHFRACAAVRNQLSTLAHNDKAIHEPREDAMRQVGRQAAGRAPGPFVSPCHLRGSIGNAFSVFVNCVPRISLTEC
jgi:hypothetical protein